MDNQKRMGKNPKKGNVAKNDAKLDNLGKAFLEREYSIWLEAIRDELGGNNSDLANMLSKHWPEDYNRRQIGLPNNEAFQQLVRTWFQSRKTLPNNRLKSERHNRPGVLESLQAIIDEKQIKTPIEATSGLSFTEIVERLQQERERSSNRTKDYGTMEDELFSRGIVSIKPRKVAQINELDLLLGASEFQGEVPPYCSRDVDSALLDKLNSDSCNPVLIVGPPKSGKTRALVEMLKKSKHSKSTIFWLEPGGGNAKLLLERTKSLSGSKVLVLDDLQNPKYIGDGGLDSKLLEELASKFKIVGTLHASTKAQWELTQLDHRTDFQELILTSPNKNLQSLLLRNQVLLNSELSDSELQTVSKTFKIAENNLSSYRYLGSKLASVSALSRILEIELSGTNAFSHALFQALVDCKIIFPKGVSIEELRRLTKRNVEDNSNSPWTESGFDSAIEKFTKGLSLRSPHAIMMRTISDRSKYTLFDPIWDAKRPETWNPSHLFGLELDFVEIADNAFELDYKGATFDILNSLDSSDPEIQYQQGRFYFLLENFSESYRWLSLAAESKHDKALDWLGDLYQEHFKEPIKAVECWKKAAELGNIWAMDSLGDFYSERGDMREAEKWWANASKEENEWAMASLGNFYLEDNRVEEGLKLLVSSANKENTWAMRKLGFFFESQGNMKRAEHWWKKGAEHHDDVSIVKLGDLEEEKGDLAMAEIWWKQGADLGNSWSIANLGLLKYRNGLVKEGNDLLIQASNLNNSWAMRQIALIKEETENISDAEAWYLRAAELDDDVAIYKLGLWAINRGNFSEGKTWFERGIALEQPLAFRGMGLYHNRIDQLNDAAVCWEKAAALGDNPSMDYLGDYFETIGDMHEAEKWWTKAAELGNSDSMFSLGLLAYESNDKFAAQQWWLKAANLSHPGSMNGLGSLAEEMSDIETAESWWKKGAALDEKWSIFDLGRLSYLNHDLETARNWFEKGINLNQAPSFRGMGVMKWESLDIDGAISMFEQAAELEDSMSMDLLGDLFEEQNNTSLAAIWWEKAAALGNSASMYSLGFLALDADQKSLAKSWFEKAAADNYVPALDALGDLAFESEDYVQANKYWTEAAQKGNQDSMLSLYHLHKDKDYKESLRWLELAAEANNRDAMKLLIEYYLAANNKQLADHWIESLNLLEETN